MDQTQPPNRPRIEVICAGSPLEMGRMQGFAQREKIVALRAALSDLEAFRLQCPWWMPYGAFLRLAERKTRRMMQSPIRHHAPHTAERLLGISAGADVRLGSLYLLNMLEAFMSSVSDRATTGAAMAACSAMAVRRTRSKTGEPIIARNFDYLPLVQPFFMLRECVPEDGYRSLEFTVAAMAGAIDGVNEQGLCITYNYAYSIDRGKPAPSISMAISQALAACANVEQACQFIAASPRIGSGILMLADAEGDIASLELSSTRSRVRRPDSDEDMIVHTNAYYTSAMREVEVPASAVFSKTSPEVIRGCRVMESADLRDVRLNELVANHRPLDDEDLREIFADHENLSPGEDNAKELRYSLCMHTDYWKTTASVQLSPKDRTMRIAYLPPCEAEYETFSL